MVTGQSLPTNEYKTSISSAEISMPDLALGIWLSGTPAAAPKHSEPI
jgi:hypothetical protein